jgi:hypothetical protein
MAEPKRSFALEAALRKIQGDMGLQYPTFRSAYLSYKDICTHLQVSRNWIETEIKSGTFPVFRYRGVKRIATLDFLRWVQMHTSTHVPSVVEAPPQFVAGREAATAQRRSRAAKTAGSAPRPTAKKRV